MTWEYCSVEYFDNLVDVLNAKGAEGWELVGKFYGELVFKRRLS